MPQYSITQLAERLNLTQFLNALRAADAGLFEAMNSTTGPYTVFAPSDAAIAALGQESWNAILADPLRLRQIMLYHLINGFYPEASLRQGIRLPVRHV